MNIQIFIPKNTEECFVSAYLHKKIERNTIEKRPAIIICPGGGYEFVSDREAEPVAMEYYTAGYQAFVLNYSVMKNARDFLPLLELASTIVEIRLRAAEWGINPNKIAVCGFSAGGHLAASLGTLYNDEKFMKIFPSLGSIRPDAMILGYPVITSDEYAHEGSISNVSGAKKGSEDYTYFGLDKHVDKNTPPTFLWHTADDTCVPVENSLKFATSLSAARVPFELHVFPKGEHGISVCTNEVGTYDLYNGRWVEWSIVWLDKIFEFKG